MIGLVALLRERLAGPSATWLHRGLTSQDVIDTALMLCLRDAVIRIRGELTAQVRTLVGLAETQHRSPMLARTLTQPALPSTVGAKIANWLSGVLDAAETLAAVPALPVQMGGAAGTLAATTELTGSPVDALALSDALATALGLRAAAPWHTTRSVITRAGDALVGCCDAWGHIAADVATGSQARNRRTGRGPRWRLVDHAAQEQSRAFGADPPRRTHRACAGSHPARRVGGQCRRTLRRRLARRMGDAAHA